MSNIDIKKVIASIPEKNNAQIYNNLRIKSISVSAAKDEKVRYWVNITLDKPVRGSYIDSIVNDVPHYAIGLTTTIMVPIGSIYTLLFDALFECDDDTKVSLSNGKEKKVSKLAESLVNAKGLLKADFEKLAIDKAYVSTVSALLIKANVNVISRDVFKEDGTIESLFSLNKREHQINNDSVWHDVYGLTNIDADNIVDCYEELVASHPAQPATTQPAANPLQALLAALGGAGNANVAASALQ